MERSADSYEGWGDVVIFAGCTAALIGEVAGVRRGDINTATWTVHRQTTPSPAAWPARAPRVSAPGRPPSSPRVRELVRRRLDDEPNARLVTDPRGGRISTAVLRDATHWHEVVTELCPERPSRQGLVPN
ncbi:hypothetical protein [Nonomuraea typhae]|uniref:Uncharacterized protein n=1 Tax=Nonomuraea typhae TaxID=2603600 RepID=A0ABW7YPH7_9ACTN